VKHLKNSQQMNYATGHDNSYANREREILQVFLKKASPQSCRSLPLGGSSITAAAALVDRDVLTRVWDEMEYDIDICHTTKVDTLSICEICKKYLVRLSVSLCNKIWYPLGRLYTANFLNVSRTYE
jgi:hypothetical protein